MSKDGIALHLIRTFLSRNNENTKEKQNFVLSNFRVFVIIFYVFPLSAESEWGLVT